MNEFKVEKQGNVLYLVYPVFNEFELDMSNVEKITSCSIYGLAPVSIDNMGMYKCLKYNISNKITLLGYLNKCVKKDLFIKILASIAQTMIFMGKRQIPYNAMVFAKNHIYVDVAEGMISMICVPLANNNQYVNLSDFFKEIVTTASCDEQEDLSYIREIIIYLNNNSNLNLEAFKEFLINLSSPQLQQMSVPQQNMAAVPNKNEKKKLFGGKNKNNAANMQPQQMAIPPQQMAVQPQQTAVPPQQMAVPPQQTAVPPQQMAVPPQNNSQQYSQNVSTQSAKQPSIAEAAAAVAGETVDLSLYANVQNEIKPVITRIKTGEKYTVKGDITKIGREPSNSDYCIRDNMAIGRCHASIVKKNSEYFIIDNNSKNHTYVDGRRIVSGEEQLLSNGIKFTLANEDFEFKIM